LLNPHSSACFRFYICSIIANNLLHGINKKPCKAMIYIVLQLPLPASQKTWSSDGKCTQQFNQRLGMFTSLRPVVESFTPVSRLMCSAVFRSIVTFIPVSRLKVPNFFGGTSRSVWYWLNPALHVLRPVNVNGRLRR